MEGMEGKEGWKRFLSFPPLLPFRKNGAMFMEVLMMRQMTAEEIGLDMETVIRFLRFYSDDKVIDGLRKLYGDEKIIQKIDEERALKELTRKMGEERAVKELAQTIGEKRLRQIVEQLFSKKSDNNDD